MSKLYVDEIQPKTTGGTVTVTNPTVPFGKVLQVVSTTSDSSNTGQVTGLTAVTSLSITPSSTSSKIFITAMGSGSIICDSNAIMSSSIHRGNTGGTVLTNHYQGLTGSGVASTAEHYVCVHHSVTDSPNTTSAQTYTWSINKGSGGTTSVRIFGADWAPITMTLMEIGA